MEKIIQIACCESDNSPVRLYALSSLGDIYFLNIRDEKWEKLKSPLDKKEGTI